MILILVHSTPPAMISVLTKSPVAVRVAPFALFLLLTGLQNSFGDAGRFWVYLAKTFTGAAMLWALRGSIPEMRWKWSWPAVLAGMGVFVAWVGLDGFYPKLSILMSRWGLAGTAAGAGAPPAWNPHLCFGQGSFLAWFFVLVRLAGSSLVVPCLEEVFFRSFLYRYLIQSDFLAVPLKLFKARAFILVAVFFAVEHQEWLPGILCGFAYQGLVCWKGRLGDAIAAHALTNLLLGIWVVATGAWRFW
jgi:hypothetical protein